MKNLTRSVEVGRYEALIRYPQVLTDIQIHPHGPTSQASKFPTFGTGSDPSVMQRGLLRIYAMTARELSKGDA